MPIFLLQPLEAGLHSPDWLASRHQADCLVAAEDAAAARRYANGAFILPFLPSGTVACAAPPWSQPQLVGVRCLDGLPEAAVGLQGSVRILSTGRATPRPPGARPPERRRLADDTPAAPRPLRAAPDDDAHPVPWGAPPLGLLEVG